MYVCIARQGYEQCIRIVEQVLEFLLRATKREHRERLGLEAANQQRLSAEQLGAEGGHSLELAALEQRIHCSRRGQVCLVAAIDQPAQLRQPPGIGVAIH